MTSAAGLWFGSAEECLQGVLETGAPQVTSASARRMSSAQGQGLLCPHCAPGKILSTSFPPHPQLICCSLWPLCLWR